MVVDFKYKDKKGKYQTVTKNIDVACIYVDNVRINHKAYYITSREYHLEESKIVVWLKS